MKILFSTFLLVFALGCATEREFESQRQEQEEEYMRTGESVKTNELDPAYGF